MRRGEDIVAAAIIIDIDDVRWRVDKIMIAIVTVIEFIL